MSVRLSFAAVFLVPVALLSGCELLEPIPIPIDLNSPPVDLDIGAAVTAGVESACSDPSAASCLGIAALCANENDPVAECDPVTLPAQFLKEIDLDGDGEIEDGESLEGLLGPDLVEAAKVQLALPVDLGEQMADAAIDPNQVKNISFDEIALGWLENSLTFDAPVLDVYIGPTVDSDALLDVPALIAGADFVKVGTISKSVGEGEEALELGQAAGVADSVPLNFDEGGKETFNEKLKTFSFTLVVAAPEGQALQLKEVAGDASRVLRPDGAASLSLQSTLIFELNLGEAAGLTDGEE